MVAMSPVFGIPSGIVAAGNKLWVRDHSGDPELHAVDIATGDLLFSVGRTGEGPGEFEGAVWGMQVVPPNSPYLWTFDSRGQRLIQVESDAPSSAWRMVSLGGSPSIARLVWLDSNTIVGVSASEEARFSVFDSTGARVRVVPGKLLGNRNEIPFDERVQASVTSFGLCAHPEGIGFVQYFRGFGRIEIFRPDATDYILAEVPFPSGPIFRSVDGARLRFTEYRAHYMDCAPVRDHLYMLYSGSLLDWDEPVFATSDAGSHVHVFSWEGRLEKVIHLDIPMHGIAVDEHSGWMYGVSYLGQPAIYRFRL